MNDLRIKTNLVYYAGQPIYGEILSDSSYVAHGMLTTKQKTQILFLHFCVSKGLMVNQETNIIYNLIHPLS